MSHTTIITETVRTNYPIEQRRCCGGGSRNPFAFQNPFNYGGGGCCSNQPVYGGYSGGFSYEEMIVCNDTPKNNSSSGWAIAGEILKGSGYVLSGVADVIYAAKGIERPESESALAKYEKYEPQQNQQPSKVIYRSYNSQPAWAGNGFASSYMPSMYSMPSMSHSNGPAYGIFMNNQFKFTNPYSSMSMGGYGMNPYGMNGMGSYGMNGMNPYGMNGMGSYGMNGMSPYGNTNYGTSMMSIPQNQQTQTNQANGTNSTNQANATNGTNQTNSTNNTNQVNQTGETNQTNGANSTNQANATNGTNQTNGANNTSQAGETNQSNATDKNKELSFSAADLEKAVKEAENKTRAEMQDKLNNAEADKLKAENENLKTQIDMAKLKKELKSAQESLNNTNLSAKDREVGNKYVELLKKAINVMNTERPNIGGAHKWASANECQAFYEVRKYQIDNNYPSKEAAEADWNAFIDQNPNYSKAHGLKKK